MEAKNFSDYLSKIEEVGYVEQIFGSVVYVRGLPRAKPFEVVVLADGGVGEVLALKRDYVEVLAFSPGSVRIGMKVARTGETMSMVCGEGLLGRSVNPLGHPYWDEVLGEGLVERPIDPPLVEMGKRKVVTSAFETGMVLADLVIPLGRGQRELVIGDRKVGKTQFLQQAMLSHAKKGGVCVYAGIARRHSEVESMNLFLERQSIKDRVVVVTSLGTDSSGLIYLTPFSAMTVAEFYRDLGWDVLLVLDDLTIHAKYYREISLLAKRFPGRGSYPGDVFYRHAKLLERAGNFEKGSITCLPVAETVFGDMSAYIATNLMSMTDGHILFDHDLYNQGRRPPINPFLSVTRVGHQTQSPLLLSLSRELTGFLVGHERMRQLVHFGGEINTLAQKTLRTGERIYALFDQPAETVIPVCLGAVLVACLWLDLWEKETISDLRRIFSGFTLLFNEDQVFKARVEKIYTQAQDFPQLIEAVKREREVFLASGDVIMKGKT